MFYRNRRHPEPEKKPEPVQSALDKDTLALIQKAYNIGENGKEILIDKAEEAEEEKIILPDESVATLEGYIQNARNTKVFLQYLLKISPHADKKVLNKVIYNTVTIQDSLNELYLQKIKISFFSEERIINTNVTYKKGLDWALYEETKALNSYIEFFIKSCNPDTEKLMQQSIYLKICNVSYLTLLG